MRTHWISAVALAFWLVGQSASAITVARCEKSAREAEISIQPEAHARLIAAVSDYAKSRGLRAWSPVDEDVWVISFGPPDHKWSIAVIGLKGGQLPVGASLAVGGPCRDLPPDLAKEWYEFLSQMDKAGFSFHLASP